MDLSKLSDADLHAMQAGDMSKVSDAGLQMLSGEAPPLWKSALNGIPKGAASLVDTMTNAPENLYNLSKMATGTALTMAGRSDLAPVVTAPPERAKDLLTQWGIIRPESEPTTAGGRVADMVGQAVGGGGVNPASVIRNGARGAILPIARDLTAAVASGAGSAIGQEFASKIDTGSESGNNALRIAAGMAGGSAPGMLLAARGTAGDRAAAALKGVTPEQMALAKALQDKARAAGSPVTGYEAIQAQTGLNPKMQTQQRIAEQSDSAAGTLTPMMQARPGANAQVAEGAFNQIAPVSQAPDTLAGRMASTAETAITDARQSGNAKAGPYYASTTGNPNARISSNDWNSLAGDPMVQKALTAVKNDPVYGVTNAPEGSVAWLDAAKKWMDDKSSAAQMGGENNAARMYKGATGQILGPVDAQFPDYAKARGIVAQNMRDVVTPMQEGQVGKLSRSDDFGKQAAALLPEKPLDVTPQVVRKTVDTLGTVDANIVPELIAQHLRGTFNESNGGGIANNPMGGYNFAKKVADNPMQRENLIEALRASGKSPTPLIDSLDIFQAQGMKPPVNSATAANVAEGSLMGGARPLDLVTRPFSAVGRASDAWRNGWATKALAKALADPNSVERLQELARTNGAHDPVKQQLLINLLLNQQSSAIPQASEPAR